MNVRLAKNWQWQAGLLHDDIYYINHYQARVYMHTTTMNATDHAVAYGRMEYWFQDIMQDSVMISHDDPLLSTYQATGQRVLVFPDQPVDQLVGIMLCLKLNAMCERRLVITDVEIMSDHGANMTYLHNQSESEGPMAGSGWWSDARPGWTTPGTHPRGSKVVSLARTAEWAALDLDWDSGAPGQNSSVLFADFNRDDDQ